jgi:ribonuclease D
MRDVFQSGRSVQSQFDILGGAQMIARLAYIYIENQKQLDTAVKELAGQRIIGVDTESSSFYTYESELCLVQITGGDKNYLVDPLGSLSLDNLAPLFADPLIVKVMHTASSDITELRRAHPFQFMNLFDVMVGGRMLGFESCSLVSLVRHYTGVSLEKTEQKSNWKKRPLSASQMQYASRDTMYLEQIYTRMKLEVENMGFLDEFEQEMVRIGREAYPAVRVYDHDHWKSVPGALQLSPRSRGLLKALLEMREERARKENIAPFRLAGNETLLRMASRMPDTLSELREAGLHPEFVRKDGEKILTIRNTVTDIQNADAKKERRPPQDPVVSALKAWRKDLAEYRGFETSMILSNRQLEVIAENKPASTADLRALDVMTDWKLENYGPMVLAVVAGQKPVRPPGLARIPPEKRKRDFSG